MSLFGIALAYLHARLSTTLLHIAMMALGVAMMTALLLFGHQVQERFYRDGAGIDAVIGAKGSPLQLILSSVQHMDIPTGNITLSEAEKIQHHPQVKQAIPISLGDNYHLFRIVGTEPAYLEHFKAEFAQGTVWHDSMEAVIGAQVARESHLKPGDHFAGSHGLMQGGHHHDDHPYLVVGVLKPTGTVLDRLITTSLESVWDIHEDEAHEEKDLGFGDLDLGEAQNPKSQILNPEKEITALLVTYRTRIAALSFPRQINRETSMQAASPAFEMARLVDLIGMGADSMMAFGGFLVAASLAGVFIGLLNTIRERRYDLAIFRILGASRKKVLLLVLMEGMIIALIGSLFGLLLGHGLLAAIGAFTGKGMEIGLEGFVFLPDVWLLWLGVLACSLIACLIPAWEAYRVDIRETLIAI